MANIIKRACSIKYTLYVIWALVIASVIGTLFPKADIYRSWWFVGLLIGLSLNLSCFMVDRLSKRIRSFGSVMIHFSIILILAGGLAGMLWGKKLDAGIREGEMYNSPHLPFKIRLVDFSLETYTVDTPTSSLLVYIKDKETSKEFPADSGQEFSFGGYSFKILQYAADFAIDMETKETFSRSNQPNNPALLVSIAGPNSHNHRWVFAKFPDFQMGSKDDNVSIIYKMPFQQEAQIKDFKSRLEVIENDRVVLSKTIEVNDPLQYKGWAVYQTDYNPDDLTWTGLHIKNDPGVGIVYAGFVLLIFGITHIFFIKPIYSTKK